MNVNYEIVKDNLQECWEYYVDYRERFATENYSDAEPQDFLDWCFEELYECPNCNCVVLKDDQTRMCDPLNPDNVCDYCIEEGGFYE